MRAIAAILLVAVTISGCTSALNAISPAPAPAPIVATIATCPTVHEFTPEQNAALATALAGISIRAKQGTSLPDDSIWRDVAEDDQKQRAQARACNSVSR